MRKHLTTRASRIVRPLWSCGKTLVANTGVVGSNPTEGKICCFLHFTLLRVECEERFCKTNIKLLNI